MSTLENNAAQVWVKSDLHQWLPEGELRQLQLGHVNALLRWAVERVPFHRRRLATHTGRPPHLKSLSELADLPVLTKAEIQANFQDMQAQGISREGWVRNATGGSTGEPLVFFRDARAQLWVDAAKERFRRWMGYLNEDKLALIWGADRDFPSQVPSNEKWLNVFNCHEKDIERFVRELLAWKPRAIRGYAGSLHLVAQFIKMRGLPAVAPHAIESSAETLTAEMRRDIEEAFGAPVFNLYGSREISCIACEDAERSGLRVADDIRLLEVVRAGRPAAAGQDGSIVVTDLVNYAMPLLRYEIGDVATAAAPGQSAAGCAFSRIERLLGRTANTITAPDGRLIHGEFFTHLFYQKPGIRMFQVRQFAAGNIEVNVVPDREFRRDTVESIVGIMRQHLGADSKIAWKTVNDIAATATGKRLFTLSDIPVRFAAARPHASDPGRRLEDVQSQPARPLASDVPGQRSKRNRKPRILFLADRPGWAFDNNARGIADALPDDFEFRIEYVVQQPDLAAIEYDLLVVMFWGETYHERFSPDPSKVIKQISSHRWALEAQFGRLTPAQMAERYLRDAAAVIVPSQRLYREFAALKPTFLTPKGFAPERLGFRHRGGGPLQIGWVGNRNDACKGLNDILLPALGRDFELKVAGGELRGEQMQAFYQSIDVLCVASTAEGDPRPLIEGMACGCFPVAVDVGIVPELVEHGRNGFIVERKVEAFQAALQWCRCNSDYVRQAGSGNAARLPESRSWSKVAPKWSAAFRAVLQGNPPKAASEVASASSPAARPPARELVLARAFDAGYAAADLEAGQAGLEATFRAATGSPHAPAGYKDAVTYALAALHERHQIIVDVGAWLGNFALNAAVLNPRASVFALEPEPANFTFLTRRAPPNVVPLRLAVADQCGVREIFISDNSQGHTVYRSLLNPTHSRSIPIRAVTFAQLIELVGGRVDFMKINAEGAEYDILPSPEFRDVGEAIVEIHLEGGQDGLGLLARVKATHTVEILEDRSPRFLFVHLRRNPPR
ncbi:MAG: FkbM family methyltransferase [Verrucomicrobiota bacterium]